MSFRCGMAVYGEWLGHACVLFVLVFHVFLLRVKRCVAFVAFKLSWGLFRHFEY